MIQVGSVYKLRGTENDPHYHVILFTAPEDNRVIACYLSSSKTHIDRTTTFTSGEDFFIGKECWVKYQNVKILSELDCRSSLFEYKGVASESTIRKIRNGFQNSLKKINRDVKDLYLEWREEALLKGNDIW
ncbi:MAG: hypothetical protein VB108_01220 [Anaerolineaceae bacterium]|nr:hypothetical protein [Anaerolineaceae bacterium]